MELLPPELLDIISKYCSCRIIRILHVTNRNLNLTFPYKIMLQKTDYWKRKNNCYILQNNLVYNNKGEHALLLYENDPFFNHNYDYFMIDNKYKMSKNIQIQLRLFLPYILYNLSTFDFDITEHEMIDDIEREIIKIYNECIKSLSQFSLVEKNKILHNMVEQMLAFYNDESRVKFVDPNKEFIIHQKFNNQIKRYSEYIDYDIRSSIYLLKK